jgi:hypothetical protein
MSGEVWRAVILESSRMSIGFVHPPMTMELSWMGTRNVVADKKKSRGFDWAAASEIDSIVGN